uniref:C2H2-type domain-containing protein n=1 Tax=Oncorhynchus kisutch TaxID=8019 RepID=A0A8C7EZG1_ONCKI
ISHQKQDFFNCTVCLMRFSSRGSLQQHLNKEHHNERPFKCQSCGKTFALKRYLRDHERRQHKFGTERAHPTYKATDSESQYKCSARGRPKGRPKGTGKTCEYCGRHFDFVSVYTVHLRTHTGERPYKCIDCDQDFAQLSNLKSHVKKHNKRCQPLKCPYCKMKFSNSEELLAHCKWHSQNPNQDSEPESKTKDNRNEATHTPLVSLKERRKRGKGGILKCHICGKVFPFWSGLQVHIRMHTGEKPYICKVCGKAFSNRSSIRIHEVTHWSIKPYNCTWCGKSFTQLDLFLTQKHVILPSISQRFISLEMAYRSTNKTHKGLLY